MASKAPFTKVVDLLADMQQEMSKEEEKDTEMRKKQACWCNSNINEKTSAVETNQRRIAALSNGINRLSASHKRWTAEKEQLAKDIASSEAAKEVAQREHKKQSETFKSEEARLLGLVDDIVEAHKKIAQAPVASLVSTLREKVEAQIKETPTVSHLLDGPSAVFLQREQKPEAVVSVLHGLKTDVIANLGKMRSAETQRVLSFESMMKAKTAEMKAMEEQKQNKKESIADASQKISDNKEVISNAKLQFEEDSAFLADVKSKCGKMDKEWDQRQQTRSEEVAAIQKAMRVLKEGQFQFLQEKMPSHRESFWGHFNSLSFLQESTLFQRKTLMEQLLEAGKHDLRLVTLAMRVNIDSFTEVKRAIQNMTQSLQKEQKDEAKQQKFCLGELQENDLDTEEKNQTMKKQSAEMLELEADIQAAADQSASLQKEVDELQEQMKLASQNREKENSEFQALVLEHRRLKKSLQQATSVLQDIYAKANSFMQQQSSEPEGFGAYKRSSSGGEVIAMLQQLIKDSEVMVAEAIEADQTSQKSYEAFAAETNKAVKTKKDGISKQKKQHGNKAVLLAETSEAKHLTSSEIVQLQNVKERLHESCDFLLAQFDVRQKARSDEIEALKKAELTLSGSL